jgi:hypothetical protein
MEGPIKKISSGHGKKHPHKRVTTDHKKRAHKGSHKKHETKAKKQSHKKEVREPKAKKQTHKKEVRETKPKKSEPKEVQETKEVPIEVEEPKEVPKDVPIEVEEPKEVPKDVPVQEEAPKEVQEPICCMKEAEPKKQVCESKKQAREPKKKEAREPKKKEVREPKKKCADNHPRKQDRRHGKDRKHGCKDEDSCIVEIVKCDEDLKFIRPAETSGTFEVQSFTSAGVGAPITAIDIKTIRGHNAVADEAIVEGVSQLLPNTTIYTISFHVTFARRLRNVPSVVASLENNGAERIFINSPPFPFSAVLEQVLIIISNVTANGFDVRIHVTVLGSSIPGNPLFGAREFTKLLLHPPLLGATGIRLSFIARSEDRKRNPDNCEDLLREVKC